jgi:hypothetical protein
MDNYEGGNSTIRDFPRELLNLIGRYSPWVHLITREFSNFTIRLLWKYIRAEKVFILS